LNLNNVTLLLFAIIAVGGIIWTFIVLESVDAWHSEFPNKRTA